MEEGKPIRGLRYEAYETMAADMLAAIGEETVCRHGLAGLCVEHSTGLVLAGECSFRLQIAATHRQEALAAMGQFIDRLKKDVPIWKSPVE
jgi:molybdopterin synthase catalytic subunit